ncbi:MAG TPA: Hpt domain-containing protein, partial [bacterium]|nr:Hpt domain-containing protein [bacterium]
MVNNEMLQDFFEEAREMLEVLNQGILTLEQSGGGDISIVNEIFRSAHTLKGMSGMMGFNNMNHLTHKMENVLDKVRNGQMILASDQIDVLFECLDKLNHMLAEIANSSSDESIIVNDTIAKLEMLMSGTYSAESAKSAASVMSSSSSADVANIEKKNEFIDINYLKQISIPENIIKILTEYDVTKIQEYIEKDYNLYLLDFKFDEDFVSRNKSLVTFFKELSQYCEVITSSSLVEEIPSLPQFEPQQFDLDVVFIIATQLEKSEIIEKLKINNTKIKVLFEAYEYTGNDKDAKLETIEITFDGDFVTPELLQSFKEEAAEHIQEFNTCLLEIEKNINNYEKDYINIMFRAMHTLKGLANMFGLKPISEIAHKIENAIDYVRNGKIQIDSELVDLLLKNNDNLNNILSQLANSNKITNVNVDIQNKLNKYIENKINPERAENIDFDVDSSYFFETADKNKIKELLASKKNIYEIVFYYKEDFQEQIANFEVLKSKIELFGEVLGLTIAIEKIEDLEQFSYYEDFDLPLNLYFATEESISTIAMLVDKDESKIRKLEETEINKLLSQKDMQRTFGRVKKTKPKPT